VGEYIGMTQSIIGGGYFLTKWGALWRKFVWNKSYGLGDQPQWYVHPTKAAV
jgi:hypothetical protein